MSKQIDLKLAKQYLEEANSLSKAQKYEEAIKLHRQAIEVYEKWELWVDWIEANCEMAGTYSKSMKYEQRLKHLQQVLKKGKKYLDENHSVLGTCTYEIGISYDSLGKYDLAISFFQDSLAIRKKSLGTSHPTTAKSLNSIGVCYFYKGDSDLAIHYTKESLAIYEDHFEESHSLMGPCLNNLGLCYNQKGNYDLAIDFYQKSLDVCKKDLEWEHPFVALKLNNIGTCYSNRGDYDLAIRYHQEAAAIYKKVLGEEHIYRAMCLINLGRCYLHKGNYDLAIKHQQTSFDICKKQLGEDHPNVAHSLQAIGNSYYVKEDYLQAIEYHQKSLTIRKKSLGKEHATVAKTLNTIGACYTDNGTHTLAIPFDQEALTIYQKQFGEKHPEIAKCFNRLGDSYLELENHELSFSYFQKALIALSPSFNQKNTYLNPNLQGYSGGYAFLDALYGKTKILLYLSQQNQSLKNLLAALSTIFLATDLVSDIRQGYKTEGAKHTLAEKTAKTYNQAIKIALETAKAYSHLPEIPQHPEFTNIPYTAQGAENLTFRFAEQSKAVLLLSSLKDEEAKFASHIPSELLEKEEELKIDLNYLDKSIATQKAKGDKKDEELLSKFQSQYFKQKQEYDTLIEQFEADYPEYHQLKYSISSASVQDLQNYLRKKDSPTTIQQYSHSTIKLYKHSAFISYHIAKEKIYIFVITSNDYQITEFQIGNTLSDSIEQLQMAIEVGHTDYFVEAATQLFDLLLRPIWKYVESASHLIIIPHGELYYVPFDVLINQEQITDASKFEKLPYLIRSYNISYHYSATMLLHSHKKQQKTGEQIDSFFGLAPIQFQGENTDKKKKGYVVKSGGVQEKSRRRILKSSGNVETALQDLEATEAEVKEIYELFEKQGKEAIALFYDQANKENLKTYIGDYKYVLISTHGFLQETDKNTLSGIHLALPKTVDGKRETEDWEHQRIDGRKEVEIEFDDYILHTSETYHLNLNADLVVLSSCESGIGKLQQGEGMMALNRGFLYSGAANIVYSLFKVPQDSTSQLTQSLFRYILEGDGYAQALRKAKLELIGKEIMEPRDWAGFALVGG
ncbi:MAG: tetratricopeptide repeat protein [Chitinophagales bacterium]